MNKIILSGGIVRDSTLKFIAGSGTAVLNFDLATKSGYGEHKYTEYTPCVMFGSRAEKLAEYLNKGTQILIEGEKKTENWEKEGHKFYKATCRVNNLEFISKKSNSTDKSNKKFDTDTNFSDNPDDEIKQEDFSDFQTVSDLEVPF